MSAGFKGLIISVVFMIGFYGLMYIGYRLVFGKNFIKKNFTKRQIIFFVVAIMAMCVFVAYIISQNKYVYTWDSAGYWTWSYQHMEKLYSTPGLAMEDLWKSIIDTDYNLIIPTIISLPLKIFGFTFTRYVMVNFLMSVIPTLIIAVCLSKKMLDKFRGSMGKMKDWKMCLLTIAVFVFFMVRFIVLFQGYVDMMLLIPIMLLIGMVIKLDFKTFNKKQAIKFAVMGLILAVTFLLRRYTAFFVVSYVGVVAVVGTIQLRKKNLKPVIMSFVVLCMTSLGTMLVFFHGLVFRVLKENYADMYSAYSGTLGENLESLLTRFGIVIIALALIGVIAGIKRKQIRPMMLMMISIIVITVALFFRVQRMDGHHVLTITPPLFVLFLFGLFQLWYLRCTGMRKGAILVVSVLLGLEPVYVYGNVFVGDGWSYVFGQHYIPLRRSDMEVLYEMRDYLNAINSKDEKVYVLSSSVEFNWNTLSNLNKPYSEWAVDGQVMTHDVDLRDGFPTVFLDAQIIVTTNPIQLHLKEGSQEVIRYLAEKVQDPGSYLGDNFERDSRTFTLEDGTEVYIYRKINDLVEKDYDKLFEYFNNYYPDRYEIFGERIREYQKSVL